VRLSNKHEVKETIPVVEIEKSEEGEEKIFGEVGLISTEEQDKDPELTEISEKEGEPMKEKEEEEREKEEPEEERIKAEFPTEEYNEWNMILSIVKLPVLRMVEGLELNE
jgi:hypothetical protein